MKKGRIAYNTPIRNVELKKRRLKQAVGEILQKKGYRSLGLNKISVEAGISKNLIYRYFGNYQTLIEQYAEEIDFWLSLPNNMDLLCDDEAEYFTSLFADMFNYHRDHRALQHLILWELQESNQITAGLLRKREKVGESFFALRDAGFEDKIDFRALMAILVASIYHLSAYSATQKVTFCGIDLHSEIGRKRILETIGVILKNSCNSNVDTKQ